MNRVIRNSIGSYAIFYQYGGYRQAPAKGYIRELDEEMGQVVLEGPGRSPSSIVMVRLRNVISLQIFPEEPEREQHRKATGKFGGKKR